MDLINNKDDYDELFPVTKNAEEKNIRAEALKIALDTRKFEIELYWKRATYFWAFIAASFAGYFALTGSTNRIPSYVFFLICCLGFSFTFSWYLANRGSKFWQKNWESHVDALEDDIIGPLFKTTISRDKLSFLKLHKEYPFSVSKINQLLSAFLCVIWVVLGIKSITVKGFYLTELILCILTIIFIITLIIFARSEKPKHEKKTKNCAKPSFVKRDHELPDDEN